MKERLVWIGRIVAVQPRIRLTRSFDQSSHSYLGFVLSIEGTVGGTDGAFTVAIGEKTQTKHLFQAGDRARGQCVPVEDSRRETAAFYKASALVVVERSSAAASPPPWIGSPPDLATYRARGHRRLDPTALGAGCNVCIWGALMRVEMIIDQWNPSNVRYRDETFCYGPKSCALYRAGPARKVPGRKGMVWVEEDWVDADATAHRGPDD